MGWFEDQIKQRSDLDQQLFEESFFRAAGVVLGEKTATRMSDEHIITKQAIDDILKYYHFKPVEIPAGVKGYEEQIDYCLRPHGIMKRQIQLEDNWWKDAYGPIMTRIKESDEPVALLPLPFAGYFFKDRKADRRIRVNKETSQLFESGGYCFYRPFPQKKLNIADLLLYIKDSLAISDLILILLSTLAVTLVGLLMPRITKALTGPVISSGSTKVLIAIAVFMLCTAITTQLLTSISGMLNSRVQTKTNLSVQAAMMMRVMSLPASFFRKYSAGELTSRAQSVDQLCQLLISNFLFSSLTSLSSLLYITQVFSFAPALVMPSLLIIFITVAFSTLSAVVQIRISRRQMDLNAKESGMLSLQR